MPTHVPFSSLLISAPEATPAAALESNLEKNKCPGLQPPGLLVLFTTDNIPMKDFLS